jgi:putative lipoic acid-binding regulatory protein
VVQRHAPEFNGDSIETRLSSKGGYLSLTCTIRATSREQLDALYCELSGHPMVKVVL